MTKVGANQSDILAFENLFTKEEKTLSMEKFLCQLILFLCDDLVYATSCKPPRESLKESETFNVKAMEKLIN